MHHEPQIMRDVEANVLAKPSGGLYTNEEGFTDEWQSLRVSERGGRLRILALPAIALVAVACGGGGGQSSTPGASSPVHLTGCPAKGFTHLKSASPGASAALVPKGASGALICRYVPKKQRNGLNVTQVKLGPGPRLSHLVGVLASLPEAEGGDLACGSGPLLSYLIVFSCHQGPDAYLNVSAAPCGTVTNGKDPTTYAATLELQRLLEKAVGAGRR